MVRPIGPVSVHIGTCLGEVEKFHATLCQSLDNESRRSILARPHVGDPAKIIVEIESLRIFVKSLPNPRTNK